MKWFSEFSNQKGWCFASNRKSQIYFWCHQIKRFLRDHITTNIAYESYYMNQRCQLKIRSRYDAFGFCPGRQTRYGRKYQHRSSTRRKAHFTGRYRKFRVFEYFQGEFQNITKPWVCRFVLVYERQWWKSRYRFDCWCRYFSTFQTLLIIYENV